MIGIIECHLCKGTGKRNIGSFAAADRITPTMCIGCRGRGKLVNRNEILEHAQKLIATIDSDEARALIRSIDMALSLPL